MYSGLVQWTRNLVPANKGLPTKLAVNGARHPVAVADRNLKMSNKSLLNKTPLPRSNERVMLWLRQGSLIYQLIKIFQQNDLTIVGLAGLTGDRDMHLELNLFFPITFMVCAIFQKNTI